MGEAGKIGPFRIARAISGGAGSQGALLAAVCGEEGFGGAKAGQTVALKTMPVPAGADEKSLYDSLEARTRALVSLDHPNVVRYYGCFKVEEALRTLHVAVMELLEGVCLKDRISADRHGIDADDAIAVADSVLAGLEAAASVGIVHRDVKPGNVFICRDGTVKLIDFEISRLSSSGCVAATGRFAGTYDYMAPEFADPGFQGDAKSDLYSMGVVLHEMLSGRLPYSKPDLAGRPEFEFLSRWSGKDGGAGRMDVDGEMMRILPGMSDVMGRALSIDPATRFSTAGEFRKALRTVKMIDLRSNVTGDRYRLLRLIGRGGFGEVFKARVNGSARFVAVKHLLKREYGARFRREAKVMGRLEGRGFVKFIEYFEVSYGSGGNDAFIVMELLHGMPGRSLRDALLSAGGGLPRNDVLKAFARYAEALAAMHGKGVYHRDIKPSNLYFPPGRPEDAAVMDFGIVRDLKGTLTNSGDAVPGTLEYMPPEVVYRESRGDAGMDVYALGLCLYEALSGRNAFKKLPSGHAAVEAYLKRTTSGEKPLFDSPAVLHDAPLLELLRSMTDIDRSKRISDARAVAAKLLEIECAGGRPSAACRPDERTQTGFPASRDVAGLHHEKGKADSGRNSKRIAIAAFAAVAIASAGVMLKNPAISCWNMFSASIEKKRKARLEDEENARREAEAAAGARRKEAVRAAARSEAEDVVRMFADTSFSFPSAVAGADEWRRKWRESGELGESFAECSVAIETARLDRIAEDSLKEFEFKLEEARGEAENIEIAAGGSEVAREDCICRVQDWKKRWKGFLDREEFRELEGKLAESLDARERRDAETAESERLLKERIEQRMAVLARAEREAECFISGIKAGDVAYAAASAELAGWENRYGDLKDEEACKRLSLSMKTAVESLWKAERKRKCVEDCNGWLLQIGNISASDVGNWRRCAREARMVVDEALKEGTVSDAEHGEMTRAIESAEGWSVGVVRNSLHVPVRFCGETIPGPGDRTIVVRNRYPEGAAIAADGYKPYPVTREMFDGKVLDECWKMERETGRSTVSLPEIPEGTACLVDGIERRSGERFPVKPGRHAVVWRNLKETIAGFRDFEDYSIDIQTGPGEETEVPPHQGEWRRSAAALEESKKRAGRAAALALKKDIEDMLAPLPVENRRARLEKAHSRLSDWKTPSVLGALGTGVLEGLKARYADECAKSRVLIFNGSGVPAKIAGTLGGDIEISPGETNDVAFGAMHSRKDKAKIYLPGCEIMFIPLYRDDSDGKLFAIGSGDLVPVPVPATVKAKASGADVVLRVETPNRRTIAEIKAGGEIGLRPGRYYATWMRPDHVSQEFEFTVTPDTKTFPPPRTWERSNAFTAFTEAMSQFASGASGLTKEAIDKIGTIEDPERRRRLEDLRRAVEIRERETGSKPAN